jgi:cell division protein FtsI/penicillin-binding protein 2
VQNGHKRAAVNGYKIGGKTGTAQVPNPDGPGYLDAYVHSFVGFGPVDDPEFLVLTKIDQPNIAKVGQFAETTAVPLFARVANFLLNYYQVPPTNR